MGIKGNRTRFQLVRRVPSRLVHDFELEFFSRFEEVSKMKTTFLIAILLGLALCISGTYNLMSHVSPSHLELYYFS